MTFNEIRTEILKLHDSKPAEKHTSLDIIRQSVQSTQYARFYYNYCDDDYISFEQGVLGFAENTKLLQK